MNLRRLTARTAVAGVATAVAAGALVGIGATAANAVENTTTYACTAAGSPVGDFALKVSTPVVPPTATAGQSFPPGLLSLDATVTIPATLAPTLGGAGVNGGRVDDYAAMLGTTAIKAPLKFGAPAPNPDGSVTMKGTGANEAFTLPASGTYKVQLPSSFVFTPTTAAGDFPVTVACTSAAPGDLGSIEITKAPSTLKAKVKKAGKKYQVTVKVKGDENQAELPTGKVTAKYGKKKVTKKVANGKAVIKLPKAAAGKKVKISYSGDDYVAKSKTSVKIKKAKK